MASRCEEARETLDKNWVGSSTIPAFGLYPHQWSWDTAFITYGHATYNTTKAQIELESLFEGQWENGLLPHIVFNPNVAPSAYFPGSDYWLSSTMSNDLAPLGVETSGIVNPPVHVSAVLNLVRRDPSSPQTASFLHRIYPKLSRWMGYLLNERDPDGNSLVYIRHPWESGMDNAPQWDAVLDNITVPSGSIPPYHRTDLNHSNPKDRPSNWTYDRFVFLMICARNRSYSEAAISASDGTGCPFIVEDPLFNSILVQAAKDMAELALLLKPANPTESKHWMEVASRVAKALESLWSDELRMLASRDMRTKKPLLSRVIAGFAPLLIRQPFPGGPPSYYDNLLRSLQSPATFWSQYGVPTLAIDDPRFNRRLYWRGPAWYNMDWLFLRGLQTVGSNATDTVAEGLLNRMESMVDESGMREYWDPLNGTAHGTNSFSWTAALHLDVFCDQNVN
eukprot:jgi/Bigna1/90571/estExt_fgenesh1_pg.C_730083